MKCPSCDYVRQDHDSSVHWGICPSCGISYAKWQEKADQGRLQRTPPPPMPPLPRKESFENRFLEWFFFVPSDRHESAFWGHLILYAIFFVWGWMFILHGVDAAFINGSVLHYVDLGLHAFGHVVFSVFGTLSHYLGGSLFQVLMPFHLMIFFTFYERDNFAASLCLWWTGQSCIDISPYIRDANTRSMDQLAGHGCRARCRYSSVRSTTGTVKPRNCHVHRK